VKQKHFVIMDSQAMSPTIRAVTGIEAVAEGLRTFGLTN
jgi:iron complex transport system substrate-binding protein